MESILTSIKKRLGLSEEYEAFDPEIIMEINTAFFDLNRLGVGPSEVFFIEDDTSVWTDFIPTNVKTVVREAIKTYIYSRVKLGFDPPSGTAHIEAINRRIDQLEWTINAAVESETKVTENEEG
jgi:hypothetical protein